MEVKQPKYLYTGKFGKFIKGGIVIPSYELEKNFSEEALQRGVQRGILKLNKRFEAEETETKKETKSRKRNTIELEIETNKTEGNNGSEQTDITQENN